MSGPWWSGLSGGGGSGVNATYTAATLEAARAAGTLTAGTLYSPSDISPRIIYWAETTSSLDPLGSQMAYVQETPQVPVAGGIAFGSLTTVATIDVLGYRELVCQYENLDADPLIEFEIAVRTHSTSDWVVTHYSTTAVPTTDFTSLDSMLLACYTDTASADLGSLATGNAFLRLNVEGLEDVRIRTRQGGGVDGSANFFATKIA